MAHQYHIPLGQLQQPSSQPALGPVFDILEWFPAYESCRNFFLDHAQHTWESRSLCALINIRLPVQWPEPISRSVQTSAQSPSTTSGHVSLHTFVRRLVVTGFDKEPVLHGMFGEDWRKGIGPIQDCERRNYLFTAKSVSWAEVKAHYDISPDQTVPFLRTIEDISATELDSANTSWSDWLCMQDWMLGPNAPVTSDNDSASIPRDSPLHQP